MLTPGPGGRARFVVKLRGMSSSLSYTGLLDGTTLCTLLILEAKAIMNHSLTAGPKPRYSPAPGEEKKREEDCLGLLGRNDAEGSLYLKAKHRLVLKARHHLENVIGTWYHQPCW